MLEIKPTRNIIYRFELPRVMRRNNAVYFAAGQFRYVHGKEMRVPNAVPFLPAGRTVYQECRWEDNINNHNNHCINRYQTVHCSYRYQTVHCSYRYQTVHCSYRYQTVHCSYRYQTVHCSYRYQTVHCSYRYQTVHCSYRYQTVHCIYRYQTVHFRDKRRNICKQNWMNLKLTVG